MASVAAGERPADAVIRSRIVEREVSCTISVNKVVAVAFVALLAVGILGATGVLSSSTVGFSFAGIGGGIPFLMYIHDRCAAESGCCEGVPLACALAAIPLGVGLAAGLGHVSLKAVSGVAIGYSTALLSCIPFLPDVTHNLSR